MALEQAGEVGLVVEADPGGDPCDRLAAEQALAGDHVVDGGPAQRAINVGLAVVLAASVALIWL